MQRPAWLIYVVLLLVPLLWGGAFGSTKHVLSELPPLTASAVRFWLAGGLFYLWLWWRGAWRWEEVARNARGVAALGVSGVFAYNVFFAVGMQQASAVSGSLVVAINPVATAFLAVLLGGEAWSWRLAAGVLLSFGGVLFVIARGSLEVLQGLSLQSGEVILLGAVASWTAYTLIGRRVMRSLDVAQATAASILVGAALLTLGACFEGAWWRLGSLSGQVLAELFYLAAFATVAALGLFNLGIRRLGPGRASAYINLMPPCALLIAHVCYGEPVVAAQLGGMALVVAGMVLTAGSRRA